MIPESMTVTVEEAAGLIGVSADSLYAAFRNEGFISAGPVRLWPVRCGRRMLVGRQAIAEFCASIDTARVIQTPPDIERIEVAS